MEASEVNISQGAYASNRVLRGRIDILRRRATMLTGTDKILMTMYLENGNTFRQIAELG